MKKSTQRDNRRSVRSEKYLNNRNYDLRRVVAEAVWFIRRGLDRRAVGVYSPIRIGRTRFRRRSAQVRHRCRLQTNTVRGDFIHWRVWRVNTFRLSTQRWRGNDGNHVVDVSNPPTSKGRRLSDGSIARCRRFQTSKSLQSNFVGSVYAAAASASRT